MRGSAAVLHLDPVVLSCVTGWDLTPMSVSSSEMADCRQAIQCFMEAYCVAKILRALLRCLKHHTSTPAAGDARPLKFV